MQAVKELVGLVNKALPGAWEAVVNQMYIYGSIYIFLAVFAGIGTVLAYFRLGTLSKDNDADEGSLLVFVGFMLAATCLLLLVLGVLHLANPKFWAMRTLAGMR